MIKGMRSAGINVIDLGMVMTQMVYCAQYCYQTNGGVMLTASHNPANYNGMKLAIGYSQTTGPEEVQEIRKIVESDSYFVSDEIGRLEKKDVAEDYYADVLKRIALKKKFKIVVDCSCGTTGMYAPEIFRRAGCEVI